ncbi:hypothetical protein T440DRAFT_472117 [Plenodomus tracheiphilus IPT5]|uniref:Uncharacterized protein n=1 Tax=Plenodomus tracheiphilus IPT5 TaxID=1408161 RepID=A0A6A7ATN3_9PLEO|nr:hypothetical protein T440DRAFT_472117 [Plenodomus tracheiphilus IPT5]
MEGYHNPFSAHLVPHVPHNNYRQSTIDEAKAQKVHRWSSALCPNFPGFTSAP